MEGYHVTDLKPCMCRVNQTLELQTHHTSRTQHGHLLEQKSV